MIATARTETQISWFGVCVTECVSVCVSLVVKYPHVYLLILYNIFSYHFYPVIYHIFHISTQMNVGAYSGKTEIAKHRAY